MTVTDLDDFPLADRTRDRLRAERRCDHLTCVGTCSPICRCHVKPKQPPLEAPTGEEAVLEAKQLARSARNALTVLDSLTSRDKTRPLCRIETAVVRGYADRASILRSPTLNGAISGGDDASFRILETMTTPEILDSVGDTISGGDFVGIRVDRLGNLLGQLAELVRAAELIAATISTVVDDLNALSSAHARALIEDASGVGTCVNPACQKVVTGVGNDRIRAGRCWPCYQYRLRTGNDRPRRLIEREDETTKAAAS